MGSVFSPYYRRARQRGEGDPLNHVSVNAILYGPHGKFWSMTERGRGSLERTASRLAIGPSSLSLSDDRIAIDINEWTVPVPRRLKGRIVVEAGPVFDAVHRLDAAGKHCWRPVAPCARVSVLFDRPRLGWQGRAYVDMNWGAEPLEDAFRSWTWSRSDDDHATRIHYDVEPRSGDARALALDYGEDGSVRSFEPDPVQPLPGTGWRVERRTRGSRESPATVVKTLEDTPFYSRSMLSVGGRLAVHESVDLDRFASRWVQALLPFRMPRRA